MNRIALGLAIGAGYVLGRTKKMKLAFAVGTLVAGKRMQLGPRALADLVTGQLANNPQFKEIGDQLREDLRGVGKAASGAMVARQLDAVADRLHGRTEQVRDQLAGVVPETPDLGFERNAEDEEEPEEAEYAEEAEDAEDAEDAEGAEDYEEFDDEAEPPRNDEAMKAPAKKAAKKAPAKKAAAKKTAAAEQPPAKQPPARKKAPAKKAAKKTAATARKSTSGARSAVRGARSRLPKGGGE
ncbi:DNA primase [Streptomyces sp. NPDC051963]|uniref:DNA primase n=1 Tax=Streptomyces sp. NPDC051963 TaxID=3365678 RepID=UPI0037D54696